ncbi:MAG TPA: hypothetical protein VGE74_09130, partial [Gemmata sp.]
RTPAPNPKPVTIGDVGYEPPVPRSSASVPVTAEVTGATTVTLKLQTVAPETCIRKCDKKAGERSDRLSNARQQQEWAPKPATTCSAPPFRRDIRGSAGWSGIVSSAPGACM